MSSPPKIVQLGHDRRQWEMLRIQEQDGPARRLRIRRREVYHSIHVWTSTKHPRIYTMTLVSRTTIVLILRGESDTSGNEKETEAVIEMTAVIGIRIGEATMAVTTFQTTRLLKTIVVDRVTVEIKTVTVEALDVSDQTPNPLIEIKIVNEIEIEIRIAMKNPGDRIPQTKAASVSTGEVAMIVQEVMTRSIYLSDSMREEDRKRVTGLRIRICWLKVLIRFLAGCSEKARNDPDRCEWVFRGYLGVC